MWVLFIQNIHIIHSIYSYFLILLLSSFFNFTISTILIFQSFYKVSGAQSIEYRFVFLEARFQTVWAPGQSAGCWLVVVGIIDNNNKEPGLFHEGQAPSNEFTI